LVLSSLAAEEGCIKKFVVILKRLMVHDYEVKRFCTELKVVMDFWVNTFVPAFYGNLARSRAIKVCSELQRRKTVISALVPVNLVNPYGNEVSAENPKHRVDALPTLGFPQ
jgi:hypothetical protein